jgi:hypothetical protein
MFEIRNKNLMQAEEWEISSNVIDVINSSPNHYRNLKSVLYHPNTNGPWTTGIFIFDGMCVNICKVKILTLDLLKQFECESLLVNFEAKKEQNLELQF